MIAALGTLQQQKGAPVIIAPYEILGQDGVTLFSDTSEGQRNQCDPQSDQSEAPGERGGSCSVCHRSVFQLL